LAAAATGAGAVEAGLGEGAAAPPAA